MKKWIALLLLCLTTLPLASALGAGQRVFDNAELFTAQEAQQLEAAIVEFQNNTRMDFVVLTSRDPQENQNPEAAADDFYDTGGFGLDEEHSGCLFYLNMAGGEGNRAFHLSTTGMMIDYFTDDRLDRTLSACRTYLRSGRYAAAAASTLVLTESYIRAGIPEGQYRYDVLTGQRLTARHKALTVAEILVSAAIAFAAGLCYVIFIKRGYRLKGSTYRYSYKTNSTIVITDTDDTYLRSTTTRTPRSSSGGGGGSGKGSGVHIGSSGRSHGGGGFRF